MTLRGAYGGIVAEDFLSVDRAWEPSPNAGFYIPTATTATVTRFGRKANPA